MTHQQVTNVRFEQGRNGRINRLVNQHFSFSIFKIFTSLRFHFRLNAVVSHNKPQLNKESQMKLPLARRVRRFTTDRDSATRLPFPTAEQQRLAAQ